jgi:hypothetical protein
VISPAAPASVPRLLYAVFLTLAGMNAINPVDGLKGCLVLRELVAKMPREKKIHLTKRESLALSGIPSSCLPTLTKLSTRLFPAVATRAIIGRGRPGDFLRPPPRWSDGIGR